MNAEAESLRKGKEPQSSTSLANRIKKKQEVCGLVKLVVRLADKSMLLFPSFPSLIGDLKEYS